MIVGADHEAASWRSLASYLAKAENAKACFIVLETLYTTDWILGQDAGGHFRSCAVALKLKGGKIL